MNISKKTSTASESVTITYAHGEADFSDLVHVVRCKDCKHNDPTEMCDEIPEVGYCKELETVVADNGFCSFGERKETEGCGA